MFDISTHPEHSDTSFIERINMNKYQLLYKVEKWVT